jgi:hypothetical protein
MNTPWDVLGWMMVATFGIMLLAVGIVFAYAVIVETGRTIARRRRTRTLMRDLGRE